MLAESFLEKNYFRSIQFTENKDYLLQELIDSIKLSYNLII